MLVEELKRQVEEVKAVMEANIEPVLQRGERLDTLQLQAEELNVQAEKFKKKAHRRLVGSYIVVFFCKKIPRVLKT